MSDDVFVFEEQDEPELVSPEELEQKLRDERVEMSRRALRHRAELWSEAAVTNDAFKELIAEFRRKQVRMKRFFFDQLQMGVPVDQREIDRQRGYLEGLGYLDTIVEAANKLLRKLDEESAVSEPDDNARGSDWEWPTTET